jgi:hypothetical protein
MMLMLLPHQGGEAGEGSREEGSHLIIGYDANSHHSAWGSTNTNNRGESLFNYIMQMV